MVRRSIALVLAAMGMLLALSGAAYADTTDIIQPQNETADQGFQAGTCTQELNPAPPPENCTVVTPDIFFTTAGGHPTVGFTQYTIEHEPFAPSGIPGTFVAPIPGDLLDHTIKTLRSDLPPGLTVNPEATPSRCTLAEFLNQPEPGLFVPTCKPETETGREKITLVTNEEGIELELEPGVTVPVPKWFVVPPQPGGTDVPVYNLVPADGEPAKLGFVVNGKVPVFLETEVAWESDFHESFTIKLLNTSGGGFSTLISRLVANGASTANGINGTYLTNPTTCFDPNLPQYEHLYSTWFRAESYGEPNPTFPNGSTAVEAPLPKDPPGTGPRVMQTGCGTVPFEPSIDADVTTNAIDSPTGGTVSTKLPFDPVKEGGEGNQSQSHLRSAEVTLPEGMSLNPAASQKLAACTDAQFRKGVRLYDNLCPANSRVGSAEVSSPPLAEPLKGDIYVGEQQSMDPASGKQFRILVEAKNEHEGIALRLVGEVKANPATGQLTAVFTDRNVKGPLAGNLPDGLPQVPFEEVLLRFDAAKEVLTSPPICGTFETTGRMEPWARPGTSVPVSSKFALTNQPGGGACPTALGARKFTPGFTAGSDGTKAGAYSPFRVHIGRSDGEQELRYVDVQLPQGVTGKLAGIPYCSEEAILAAVNSAGKAELASPSCPAASQIGRVTTGAGSGQHPVLLPGKAYLAGPYKGGQLSMVTVTPAVSGPFDLGTVVVRVALDVNPRTAQIRAVTPDLVPFVYGGVKLDLRQINVLVDRQEFMLNPTDCKSDAATDAVLQGGGSNPLNAAAFSTVPISVPYQASNCGDLKFKPTLHTRLFGPTKRDENPRLRAVLEARKGDANITRTALVLPHSLFLDQSHIRTVCTRVQLAAKNCPKGAIYGHARATTPLLDNPVKGPVYLVSSNHKLPDLVADLRGQVNIQLYAVIGSKRGGLKTVFYGVPDVPVSKFILNMRGGQKSLLVNSENLCKQKQEAFLNIKAQNNRRLRDKNYDLRISGCGGGKKGKKGSN